MHFNRRQLLASAAATAAYVFPNTARSQAFPLLRRDISLLADNSPELTNFKSAIAALQNLGANDPLNYTNLANVHPNACPHGNWYWLPWHRVYILYFEQACRFVLNDGTFTIPYWDWQRARKIPRPFWEQNSPLNPANSAPRTAGPGDEFPITRNEYDRILSSSALVDIYSSAPPITDLHLSGGDGLYELLHNRLHNFVGSNFAEFTSSYDPLFWAHHANIDRIWASWQRLNPGVNYPQDSDWNNFIFRDFYDPFLGRQVQEPLTKNGREENQLVQYERYDSPTVEPGRRIVGQKLLRFDPQGLAEARALRSDVNLAATVEVGGAVRASFRFDSEVGRLVDQAARGERPTELYLVAEGVEFEDSKLMGLRVFLNAPDPQPSSDADQISYVGTISSFGDEHHNDERGEGRKRFIVDLIPALQNVARVGTYSPGRLDIALVGVPLNPSFRGRTAAKVEKLSIVGRSIPA
jgi:tyrosinase